MRARPVSVALCRLSSWLDAVSVVNCPGEGNSLEVLDFSGNTQPVWVLWPSQPPPQEELYLRLEDVNSRDHGVSMLAFGILLRQLGFQPQLPVDRGAGVGVNPGSGKRRKLSYHEDFDLVAMRHSQFRDSPDPAPQRFERYRPVMLRCCRKFYSLNEWLCQRCLLNVDDLLTFAMVWTTNYVGNWQLDATHVVEENDRLLTEYLKQCFAEFYQLLRKRDRYVVLDYEAAHILQTGKPHEYHSPGPRSRGMVPEDSPAYAVDDDPDYRRSAAKRDLEWRLFKMPPAQAKAKLEEMLASQDPDVRQQARTWMGVLARRPLGKQIRNLVEGMRPGTEFTVQTLVDAFPDVNPDKVRKHFYMFTEYRCARNLVRLGKGRYASRHAPKERPQAGRRARQDLGLPPEVADDGRQVPPQQVLF